VAFRLGANRIQFPIFNQSQANEQHQINPRQYLAVKYSWFSYKLPFNWLWFCVWQACHFVLLSCPPNTVQLLPATIAIASNLGFLNGVIVLKSSYVWQLIVG